MSAERMFAREGEAGLSIRKLAEDIDYSPAAIYKYFESKQDLIDALKEAFFELLLGQMEEFSGTSEDYVQYAHEFLLLYAQIALSKPHHYAAAFAGLPDTTLPLKSPPEDSLKVQAFMNLRHMVVEGVRLGVFRSDLDIGQTSKSLWAAMHGLVSLMIHMPHFQTIMMDAAPPPEKDALIAEHIRFIVRGLTR